MARGWKIDFNGFKDMAEELDKMGGEVLRKAVEDTMIQSRDMAVKDIQDAMNTSPYQFAQGRKSQHGVGGVAKPNGSRNRRASGEATKSVWQVSQIPIQWDGNIASAYVGADLKIAPELLILALGTPHIQADKNLNNAIKCKGKYRTKMSKLQAEVFAKHLEENRK